MDTLLFLRKTLFNVIVYGIYYTAVFYFFKPVIFSDTYFLVYVIILYTAGIVDTYIRPLDTDEREEENYVKFILLLFFAGPWLFVTSIIENEWLFGGRSDIISILGLFVYFSASSIVILSRIQLGRQATGTLVIRKDHELIKSGIYRYVRHPMYFGSLFGVVGFWLVTQAVIIPMVSFLLYFWVFNARITHEEKILKQHFNSAYEEYMKDTKKLIPFIY